MKLSAAVQEDLILLSFTGVKNCSNSKGNSATQKIERERCITYKGLFKTFPNLLLYHSISMYDGKCKTFIRFLIKNYNEMGSPTRLICHLKDSGLSQGAPIALQQQLCRSSSAITIMVKELINIYAFKRHNNNIWLKSSLYKSIRVMLKWDGGILIRSFPDLRVYQLK